ncbi:response regulator [Leptolyngbya sp. FACHB-261]|uniref:response regulator n=1 Tax=Leptolyngbya sp. FACHB-261 TaxID=2692806 RepID=UPI00168999F5|nr:response regulator [Leptolyngbya sp. FACHB-261]MBD2101694.1 response regulator [Leptolyngbya sp. FACHB-261]
MINTSDQASSSASATATTSTIRQPTVISSPLEALQNIVQRKVSGRLTIREADAETVLWRIHTGDGHIHFASCSHGQRERLAYILQRNEPQLAKRLRVETISSDYEFLCQSWQAGILTLPQLRKLLYLLTREALIHIMALPQATLLFERSTGLDPILLSVPLQEALPLSYQVRGWQQLKPHISSPFQRPHLLAREQFARRLEGKLRLARGPDAAQTPLQALDAQLCIYEIASKLDADLLRVASALRDLVQADIIKMEPFTQSNQSQQLTIACIDDSLTIQRKVRLMLEGEGYRVLSLTNPLQALMPLMREKPAVVLMDISMPDLDGYELCRMLKQSSALRQTPIVMLTGRDGLVDRSRARLVGASDYITKPFDAKTLLDVISKLVQTTR